MISIFNADQSMHQWTGDLFTDSQCE